MNISLFRTPAGAGVQQGTLPLMSFNTAPTTANPPPPPTPVATRGKSSASASQQLLVACLAGAAALDPEAVQKSIDLIEKDAKKFYATTKIDEGTVRDSLRQLTLVLYGKAAAATADHFDQYIGRRLGVSPVMVASTIAHIQAGDDESSAQKLTAIVNYAVPLVGVELAQRIVTLAYNRERVNLFPQTNLGEPTMADQVRRNTENIRELMEQVRTEPTS